VIRLSDFWAVRSNARVGKAVALGLSVRGSSPGQEARHEKLRHTQPRNRSDLCMVVIEYRCSRQGLSLRPGGSAGRAQWIPVHGSYGVARCSGTPSSEQSICRVLLATVGVHHAPVSTPRRTDQRFPNGCCPLEVGFSNAAECMRSDFVCKLHREEQSPTNHRLIRSSTTSTSHRTNPPSSARRLRPHVLIASAGNTALAFFYVRECPQNSLVAVIWRALELLFVAMRSLAGLQLKLFRHPHQFGKGVSLHFVHHVAAMDLYRDFASTKFRGYLLVEHP
jgi:hypothetical protein